MIVSSLFLCTPSGAVNFRHIGIGSTYKQWVNGWGKPDHSANICMSGNACYGSLVQNNTVGVGYLFTDVTFDKGITSNFEINLSNGTHYANALHAAKFSLPADAKFGKLTPTNSGGGTSCAIMYGSSATLAREFKAAGFKSGLSAFTLEFYGTTHNQAQTYFHTTDVQIVMLSIGGFTAGC